MYKLVGLIIFSVVSILSPFFNKEQLPAAVVVAPQVQSPKPVSILMVGDIMLDRGVWWWMNKEGEDYPFKSSRDLIAGNDIVFANLEGPITHYPSKTINKPNAPLT